MFKNIKTKYNSIPEKYGVSPVTFMVLYIGTSPLFLYFLYLVIKHHKNTEAFLIYLMVDLVIFVLPFIYVLFFGKNFPKKFYPVFWIIFTLIIIISFREIWPLLLNR